MRDLRFPVGTVVIMVANNMSVDEILSEHFDLEAEDAHQVLLYAAAAVREREIPLRPSV